MPATIHNGRRIQLHGEVGDWCRVGSEGFQFQLYPVFPGKRIVVVWMGIRLTESGPIICTYAGFSIRTVVFPRLVVSFKDDGVGSIQKK